MDELGDRRGQVELGERQHLIGDHPEHPADPRAVAEHVGAESPAVLHRHRQVDLLALVERGLLGLAQHRVDQRLAAFGVEGRGVEGLETAVQTDRRGLARSEEQIRRAQLPRHAQQLLGVGADQASALFLLLVVCRLQLGLQMTGVHLVDRRQGAFVEHLLADQQLRQPGVELVDVFKGLADGEAVLELCRRDQVETEQDLAESLVVQGGSPGVGFRYRRVFDRIAL